MFKTQPQHNFQYKSSKYLNGTFDNCYKMKDFMKNIDKMAKEWVKEGYDPDKFKGDAFEFFVELLLMFHPNDSRMGIYDYEPNDPENDNGVDGFGRNFKGERAAIQIKYRSKTDKTLSGNKDSLNNLITNAMVHEFNIVMDPKDHKNYRHFIFTTADGLHWYTNNEVFKNRVKCFGLRDLRKIVDNNKPFWDSCREIIQQIMEGRNDS